MQSSRFTFGIICWIFWGGQMTFQIAQAQWFYGQGALIEELNSETHGESYPWISEDGLRLYYAKQAPQNFPSHLTLAQRPDLNSPFEEVGTFLEDHTIDHITHWLSNDELTVWFTAGADLKKATRTAIGQPFGDPITVQLVGATLTNIKSPSLTPDLSELYLRDLSTTAIWRFVYGDDDIYIYDGTLESGYADTRSGKLDHSGLSYYISAVSAQGTRIFGMSRDEIGQEFGMATMLEGDVFDPAFNWNQPMVTSDGVLLVMVRGQGLFQLNDLFLAHSGTVSVTLLETGPLKVWPNPVSDLINLRSPANVKPGSRIEIHDIQGRMIRSMILQEANSVIDVTDLIQGTYLLAMRSDDQLLRTRFIVAR